MRMSAVKRSATRAAFAGVLVLLSVAAQALDVSVLGLFEDRALLKIDGTQRLLKVGDRSPEGVLLVQADSSKAILEIDGKRGEYRLGSDIHTSFTAPDTVRVQIARNNFGMYTTAGAINGVPVTFMVDTGATSIAMNAATAERLGIGFRHNGQPLTVHTAAGPARAWAVTLKTVRVGEIERSQIQAVVIEARTNNDILLGMSFLSTVKMEKQSNLLVLEAQY